MDQWVEKNRKRIFFIVVAICFVAILLFNILTPNMSDDLGYYCVVRDAHSFWDLVKQEYEHHMEHSGRNVAHMILRIFLSQNTRAVFNVFNALVFTLLGFEIYWNASERKKYNISLYIIIQLLLWSSAVKFDETILWEDGSCNYLWTTAIIMGFITVYRRCLSESEVLLQRSKARRILLAVGMFFFGVLAGWSNENNSGGCFLLTMCFLLIAWKELKKDAWVYTGPVGVLTGMGLMLSSPGNWSRNELDSANDKYTGIVGIASHFVKATDTMKRLFWVIIVILIAMLVVLLLRKYTFQKIRTVLVWTVCGFLTGYVLILTAEPVDRAYFGMGIFLITAVTDSISMVCKDAEYKPIRWLELTIVLSGCLWLITTWMQEGTTLARIYRDYEERDEIAQAQLDAGEETLVLPMVHSQFESKYSFAKTVELSEDPNYWVNIFYLNYYNVYSVTGVDRETWDAQYKDIWG